MATDKKTAAILKAARALKGIKATSIDDDIICCVPVSILRHDQVDSGSMRVNIPTYYNFGQMVVLFVGDRMTPEQETSKDFWGSAGALCLLVNSADSAASALSEISDRINTSREQPEGAYIVD